MGHCFSCLFRLDVGHDVGRRHNQEIILTVHLDFSTGPIAQKDNVADVDIERDQFATFIARTRYSNGCTFVRQFLGTTG